MNKLSELLSILNSTTLPLEVGMLNLNHVTHPGEHPFVFSGAVGSIEAVLSMPAAAVDGRYVVLLGHPHSLQGGSMNNKVVTTLARMFNAMGIPGIRFNFRGVGQSAGVYDDGVGESEDMMLLARECQHAWPKATLIFAGFSFGSYVAYRAASHCASGLLISVAPPVHHYDFSEFSSVKFPWIIVQGDADEVVPVQGVRDFIAQSVSPITVLEFADTGHFFHGKLIELKTRLTEAINSTGVLCC